MLRADVRPAEILLVEDNPGDVELTRVALEKARVRNHLTVAKDGAEALTILRREGSHQDAPTPDLVILDLDLPRIHGREVLAKMREDPRLTHLPIIILTSSDDERDVLKSYRLHANAYITKPIDFHEFVDVISAIEGFWLEIVKLPQEPGEKPGD